MDQDNLARQEIQQELQPELQRNAEVMQYSYEDQNPVKELELDSRQAKKIINYAGFSMFFMAVAVLGVQLGLSALFGYFYPSAKETDWYIWFVTFTSMIVIGFPLVCLLMKTIPDTPKGEKVSLKPLHFFMIFFICYAGMTIANLFSLLLTTGISLLKGTSVQNPISDVMTNGNMIMTLIYVPILAPIMEEIIFRKLLLDKLRRFGDVPAILITGLAFGLFHMNLSQMFYAAVLGFIFAYVVIKTNTIRYSIFLHMMINTYSTVCLVLALKKQMIFTMLLGQLGLLMIIAGIVSFVLMFKKIKFNKVQLPIKKSAFLLNPGTLLYIAVCMVMIVMITIS